MNKRLNFVDFLNNICFYLKIAQCSGSTLRKIDLGGLTAVNDDSIRKILLMKSLENLEEFHCEKSSLLSIATANLLINNCDNLKAISDLQNWSELDPSYLGNLMERYGTKYDSIIKTC